MGQPICITHESGVIEYRLNGQLHREDGPAMQDSYGNQIWYQHGKLHRDDGPAINWQDGTEEFCLEGKEVDIMVHFLQRPG